MDIDAAAERQLKHSTPGTFIRGIQLSKIIKKDNFVLFFKIAASCHPGFSIESTFIPYCYLPLLFNPASQN
jgi:hypothetical protein